MLTEACRRRAAEMTEDLSIWEGSPLSIAMAVVLREHMTEVARLEHSLADAMEQIEAIQGLDAEYMNRVRELEAKLYRRNERIEVLQGCQDRLRELEAKLAHELEHFRRRQATWNDTRASLKAQVVELTQDAPTYRHMDEAPKSCGPILAVTRIVWDATHEMWVPVDGVQEFDIDVIDGWLPDQRGEVCENCGRSDCEPSGEEKPNG